MALLLKISKASVAIATVLGLKKNLGKKKNRKKKTEKYDITMYSSQTIAALKGMPWVVLVLDFLSSQIPSVPLIHPCYVIHPNCIH